MNYPSRKDVENADRFTLCKWWRFLRPPATDEQIEIHRAITERFREVGGFTSEISKRLGWDDIY